MNARLSMTPGLETRRLRLRWFVETDLPVLVNLAGRREIADTMISVPYPYTEVYAREWLASARLAEDRGEAFHLAVCERGGDRLVGAIELRAIDREHRQAELSFWIGVEYWGLGYATEAAGRVIRYGFVQLEVNRIYAHHMLRNPASGVVLAKLGMRREGILRQRVRKWGVYEDVALWAILRDDAAHRRDPTSPPPGFQVPDYP